MEVLVLPRYKLLGWKGLDRNLKKMAGQQMQGAQSMLDLNFQSLAMQNMDMKQMELDTAVAKVDELSKQLENMWSDSIPTSHNNHPPATEQNKNNRYEAGLLMSQEQFVKGNTSSSSPSLSSRKMLATEVNDNYLPAPSRSGTTPASYSIPALVYNPPPHQPNTLSSVSQKNSLARSSSPRPMYYLSDQKPLVDRPQSPRPQSPRPMGVPSNYDIPYLSQPGRASSPRPMQMRPMAPSDHLSPVRPMMGGQYDYVIYGGQPGRAASPRPVSTPPQNSMSQAFFPDRLPSPRLPSVQSYEIPSVYASAVNAGSSAVTPLRSSDDMSTMRRRPQKSWNESDLDVTYEKKPSQHTNYDRGDAVVGFRPGIPVGSWRESSLDMAPVQGKDDPPALNNATLPKNYKFSSLERRQDPGFWRSHSGGHTSTLPRNWQASQQPISRIPIPPSPQGVRPKPQKPIPLSMIFKLQNAFWEHRAPSMVGKTQQQPQMLVPTPPTQQTPSPGRSVSVSESNGKSLSPDGFEGLQDPFKGTPNTPEMGEIEPELETLIPASDPSQVEEVPRPLSPTRLQPILPPEAQKVPELEEIRRVLEDIPRPLKRRGSMEQTTSVPLPTHKKQYQLIMSKLFRRHSPKETVTLVGEAVTAPQSELPIIIEGSEAKVGASLPQETLLAPVTLAPAPVTLAPVTLAPAPVTLAPVNMSPEKRSVLKKVSSPRKANSRRARLNPLVLLLDAALTGELDVVQQAVNEMSDPSLANDEGITALHNAICGANYDIVDFLINIGVNVNAPDSHGWTPLHCAASCNDTTICVSLVKHGAAIYTTTFSDGTTAIEKCDPYREGYKECYSYLAEVEQSMGLVNNGVVYALWSYSAEFSDELSFHENDPVTILRRDDQEEMEWWWASLYGQEGYVPKNYFGLFPRVRAQRSPV